MNESGSPYYIIHGNQLIVYLKGWYCGLVGKAIVCNAGIPY